MEDAAIALKNAKASSCPTDSDLKDFIDAIKKHVNAIPSISKTPDDLKREVGALKKKVNDLDNRARGLLERHQRKVPSLLT